MISVKEAKEQIADRLAPQPVRLPLEMAAGLVLAENVHATMDLPAFAQSSMDGYAIRYSEKDVPLSIRHRIAAGDSGSYTLAAGEACRIFTGAPLPLGADTVVMQEKAEAGSGFLRIQDDRLQRGDHVRSKGMEIGAGELALETGTTLTPAAAGFLAALGLAEVCVYPVPKVSLIVTGNELQTPGSPLSYGQVYESNSVTLRAALRHAGIQAVGVMHAEDRPEAVTSALMEALEKSDFVLLTGGVSVGDYDFVPEAAAKCGVETCFHRIRQRPGKPLYFGIRDNKVVFGLPGNPGSVLTCFYEYVMTAIDVITRRKASVKKTTAVLRCEYVKNTGLTHFLRGLYQGGEVSVLPAQVSFQLRSFASANCLIVIDEATELVKKGAAVEVHLLPL